MDAAQAETRLRAMTAADSDPVLTEDELDQLVLLARRADTDGLSISDADWTETYDLNAAAAEGWRWKAGKAASDVTFRSDGQGFDLSDLIKHCRAMAKDYTSRRAYSVLLTSGMTVISTEA